MKAVSLLFLGWEITASHPSLAFGVTVICYCPVAVYVPASSGEKWHGKMTRSRPAGGGGSSYVLHDMISPSERQLPSSLLINVFPCLIYHKLSSFLRLKIFKLVHLFFFITS